MKLKDLIEQCLGEEKIQINWNNNDWLVYDEFNAYSPALKHFENYQIHSLTAIDEDIFRLSINEVIK